MIKSVDELGSLDFLNGLLSEFNRWVVNWMCFIF